MMCSQYQYPSYFPRARRIRHVYCTVVFPCFIIGVYFSYSHKGNQLIAKRWFNLSINKRCNVTMGFIRPRNKSRSKEGFWPRNFDRGQWNFSFNVISHSQRVRDLVYYPPRCISRSIRAAPLFDIITLTVLITQNASCTLKHIRRPWTAPSALHWRIKWNLPAILLLIIISGTSFSLKA